MYSLTAYETDTIPAEASVAHLTQFRANEAVMVDGEGGLVLDSYTSSFTYDEEKYDASSDEPKYVVATKSGTDVYTESELTESDPDEAFQRDNGKLNDPTESMDEAELASAYDRDGSVAELANSELGWNEYPNSWDDSPRHNRLILLDAWASMGASFRGCRREMKKHTSQPNAFCAAMKDEIYKTTEWR